MNWTGVNTLSDILNVANTNTGGWFWLAMLFLIFIVILLIMIIKEVGIEISLLTSGFVGLVSGIFLTYMDLIAWKWTLVFVGTLLMTFLYIIYSSNRDNQ